MNLSKIIGGMLLIGAGCGSALAQGSAVAGAAPTSHGSVASGSHFVGRGEVLATRPFHRFHDKHGPHDPPTDRHRGRHHRFGGFLSVWGLGYWGYGGGYVYSEPTRDMFGYFGAGGDVRLVGNEAFYDYDRSYPYDWYSGPPAEARATTPPPVPASSYRCETNWVPDGSGGGTVPIRVCRR